ncbi:MAG: hypothetical protein J7L42_00765 [Elusimicrobia bacterium]|nr:hypothetical protein [Elusimicrobiota bacterium]
MSKSDKIWLAVGIPVFIFMLLSMGRVFSYSKSIKGKKVYECKKYRISLEGGSFLSFWRNFYKIKKEQGSDLYINVKCPQETLYAMVNFYIYNINPQKAKVSGAAHTDIKRGRNSINFAIRVGSRKNIVLKISDR